MNIDNTFIKNNLNHKIKVKFCVFVGRELNLRILHKYIELALFNNIFDEYHMFDFSRNIKDSEFIIKEYTSIISRIGRKGTIYFCIFIYYVH